MVVDRAPQTADAARTVHGAKLDGMPPGARRRRLPVAASPVYSSERTLLWG